MSFQHPPRQTTRSDRPNIIWLLGDQHRHHAMGYAGDPNLHTPVIDDLTHHGLVCADGAVSGAPLCCPYRGSLLTSRWPHHCVPAHEARMPDGLPTVATAFNAHGYHTAWIGKWHVDGCHERDGRAVDWIVPPERRGDFQLWEGYENNNDQWDCWLHGGSGAEAFHRRLPGWETDALTERFCRHLDERATEDDTPFFAALSVQPPHWPCHCPPEWRDLRRDEVQLRPNVPLGGAVEARAREALPGYYGMIANWDHNVGRIIAKLREHDLFENTHILFFADHGEMMGSHGLFGKCTAQEESIRVPFLFAGGSRYDRLISGATQAFCNHVDIAPTSLGLAGLPVPDWMQGTDASHVRLGGDPRMAQPDSTYIQNIDHREGAPPYRAIVTTDGWKYAATRFGPWLMYNLNEDPYEQANLALVPRQRQQRAHLDARLRQWIADTGDDFPLPEL